MVRPVRGGTMVSVSIHEQAGRQVVELPGPECWKLLGSVVLGRVVFSHHALPAVRVVRHLVDENAIIVRSPRDDVITGHGETVVCYEADDMDADRRTGWSVVVTGVARPVREPAAMARYGRLLAACAAGEAGQVIAIEPRLITGRRLVFSGPV